MGGLKDRGCDRTLRDTREWLQALANPICAAERWWLQPFRFQIQADFPVHTCSLLHLASSSFLLYFTQSPALHLLVLAFHFLVAMHHPGGHLHLSSQWSYVRHL